MENWEIGRAQGTGLNLVDLNTENLIDLIRNLVYDLYLANEYAISLEDGQEFLEKYNDYQATIKG